MKIACICLCAVLFSALASPAAPASPAPLPSEALAAILGQPAAADCAVEPRAARPSAPRGGFEKSYCQATASCGSGSVSCEGNSTCSARDRDCAIPEQGYVTCDGVRTSCPKACSACDTCSATGDCYYCCICDGHPPLICARAC